MFNHVRLELHNDLVKEISEKFKLDRQIVETIIRSQWDFIENVITETDPNKKFLGVKVKYLGCFGVSNLRFKHSKFYDHYHVPKEFIERNVDPRTWREQFEIETSKDI